MFIVLIGEKDEHEEVHPCTRNPQSVVDAKVLNANRHR